MNQQSLCNSFQLISIWNVPPSHLRYLIGFLLQLPPFSFHLCNEETIGYSYLPMERQMDTEMVMEEEKSENKGSKRKMCNQVEKFYSIKFS